MYNKEHKYMQSKSIRLFDQQTDYYYLITLILRNNK